MRILHVTPYYYPAWVYGGVPRSLFGLCREQARQGDEVRVLTTDVLDENRRDPGPSLRDVEGIRARYLPNVSNVLAQRAQVYLPRSGWTPAAAWIDWAEAVHFHCHRILFFHFLAPFLRGRPYVLTPRGSAGLHEGRILRKRVYDLLLGDRFLFGAARVVALSEIERESLLGRGIPPGRIAVIGHGIDWGERSPESRVPSSGSFDLLYLGKITPLKGLETLLEAIAPMGGIRLAVAGNDNGYADLLRAKAARLGLDGRVLFPGFLHDGPKEAALRSARALVCPSRFEAFGLAPLEALRAGVPVVVSRGAGCAGILEGEGLAHGAEAGDPVSLREGIGRALADDRRGPDLARLARQKLEGVFGWPSVARAYRKVYEEVLSAED